MKNLGKLETKLNELENRHLGVRIVHQLTKDKFRVNGKVINKKELDKICCDKRYKIIVDDIEFKLNEKQEVQK